MVGSLMYFISEVNLVLCTASRDTSVFFLVAIFHGNSVVAQVFIAQVRFDVAQVVCVCRLLT
jgi:hypothetical protein